MCIRDSPADLFTCCLTCPIEISIRIFLMQSPLKHSKYKIFFESTSNDSNTESFKANVPTVSIPGVLSDRRTPLGELNWIFTAVTDTIAWTSLPRPLFKKLFRHDLMIAALFRNFLLAKRIMPWYNCHPISDPELPDSIADHPMWKSWDLAMDEVLGKLVTELKNSPPTSDLEKQLILQQNDVNSGITQQSAKVQPGKQKIQPESIQTQSKFAVSNLSTISLVNHPALQNQGKKVQNVVLPSNSQQSQQQQQQQQQFTGFFEQNLTAFELWLKYASNSRHPPEQLPIVLQVLLSQVHRIRALVLLSRFLDLGPWAVYLSLSIGIFPYVLKLLQSPAPELKPILVFIWARIMSIDYKNTQAELIKERGYIYFISILVPEWGYNLTPSRSTSFINGVPMTPTTPTTPSLPMGAQPPHANDTTDEQKAMAVFVLASFVRDYKPGQKLCFSLELITKLSFYIDNSDIPLLRQWCILLIGLLYIQNPLNKFMCMNNGTLETLLLTLKDPVPEVRTAVILTLKHFISDLDDADIIIRTQQEYEQQISQIHAQLQQLQNSPQQQQHNVEQQQLKLEQQLNHIQLMESQLENVELIKLKQQELSNLIATLALINDGSPLVRKEVIIFFSQIVYRYTNFFLVVVFNELTDEISQLEGKDMEQSKPNYGENRHSVSHGSVFSTVWKALLILAEDPYLENKKMAEQVVDYILLELSSQNELGSVFGKIEHYLVKRSTQMTGTTNLNFNATQIQIGKNTLRQFNKNKETDSSLNNNTNNLNSNDPDRFVTLSRLFKKLGFGEPTLESDSVRAKKPSNIHLLGAAYGTSYTCLLYTSRCV